jgi:hypothetical protein
MTNTTTTNHSKYIKTSSRVIFYSIIYKPMTEQGQQPMADDFDFIVANATHPQQP